MDVPERGHIMTISKLVPDIYNPPKNLYLALPSCFQRMLTKPRENRHNLQASFPAAATAASRSCLGMRTDTLQKA